MSKLSSSQAQLLLGLTSFSLNIAEISVVLCILEIFFNMAELGFFFFEYGRNFLRVVHISNLVFNVINILEN